MFRSGIPIANLAALVAGLAAASPAQAAINPGYLNLAFVATIPLPNDACGAGVEPASGAAIPQLAVSAPTKAAALLGGRGSQLDLIRQQQGGLAPASGLAPAAGLAIANPLPAVLTGRPCNPALLAAAKPGTELLKYAAAPVRTAPLSPDDFLASKRLPIRRTSFDRDWNRVRGGGLSGRETAALVEVGRSAPQLALLEAVNSWANAKIRYVEDRELYGRADYWASANETLRRRAGDCEDIAIAKLQALAALGVPRDKMFLTIVRDTVRAADHAVLIVQLEGKAWVLDNNTNQLLDASASYDYRPILSFSAGRKWIHGY